jgi:hypothetical protein
MATFEELQARVKAIYGDKCLVPPMPESIPDDNPSYNKQGFSRESVLDVFIQALIDKANGLFDANFATTLATGMYGIESMYGSTTQDNWGGTYVGPLQVGNAFMTEFGPAGGSKANIIDQMLAVQNFAVKAYNKLKDGFPGLTIDPFHIYIMHQQGMGGGFKLIGANPDTLAKDVIGSGALQQAGYNTLYGPNATVKQFLDAQKTLFDQSAARGGGGNCGEFAVEFLAGSG